MIKIYSKVQEGLLLHLVFRFDEFEKIEGRQDIINPENILQCAALNYGEGKTFKPHRHKIKQNVFSEAITQESWVILQGKVRCSFYDIDDKFLTEVDLFAGDASFTLCGGHTYTVLSEESKIYELKTGPYNGQSEDKVFI